MRPIALSALMTMLLGRFLSQGQIMTVLTTPYDCGPF